MCNRLAHAAVFHHLVAGVYEKREPFQALGLCDANVFGRRKFFDIRGLQARRDVDLSRIECCPCCGRIGDDDPADIFCFGPLSAGITALRFGARNISVKALEQHILPALPLRDLIGAGADRPGPVACGVHGIGMKDCAQALEIGHLFQQQIVGARQAKDRRIRIGRLDGRDADTMAAVIPVPAEEARGGVEEPVPAPLDFARGHRRAVLKPNALAQVKRVGQSVG